jgi:hypothetical protein
LPVLTGAPNKRIVRRSSEFVYCPDKSSGVHTLLWH